jgi:hypothetical protein
LRNAGLELDLLYEPSRFPESLSEALYEDLPLLRGEELSSLLRNPVPAFLYGRSPRESDDPRFGPKDFFSPLSESLPDLKGFDEEDLRLDEKFLPEELDLELPRLPEPDERPDELSLGIWFC